jgi:uncharacterized surface protein with fasciclin (FAS1) repeats
MNAVSTLGAILVVCLLALSSAPATAQTPNNVVEVLGNARELTLFTVLLEEAGLDDDISNGDLGEVTVFAPTDVAFEDSNEEFLTYLLTEEQWVAHLRNLIGYHIVPAAVQLVAGEDVGTITGGTITVSESPSGNAMMMLNGMAGVGNKYSTPDSGSIVYGIDALLDPGWVEKNIDNVLASDEAGRFSTFVDIGSKLILIDVWRPLTVFAPTDAAFDASGIDFENNLDENFLFETWGLHVVEGIYPEGALPDTLQTLSGDTLVVETDPILRTVRVNGQRLVQTNLFANNGIIHVVEGLLSSDDSAVNPVELELCEFQKFTEEAIGELSGVACSCSIVGTNVALTCTASDGKEQCIPKNGICDEDQGLMCCSPQQRRCAFNQCRDSRRPVRVKIGAGQDGVGGSVRPRRDRNGSIRSESIP